MAKKKTPKERPRTERIGKILKERKRKGIGTKGKMTKIKAAVKKLY